MPATSRGLSSSSGNQPLGLIIFFGYRMNHLGLNENSSRIGSGEFIGDYWLAEAKGEKVGHYQCMELIRNSGSELSLYWRAVEAEWSCISVLRL